MILSFFVPRGTPFRVQNFEDTGIHGYFDSMTNNDNLFTNDQGGFVSEFNAGGYQHNYFQFNVGNWSLRFDPKYVEVRKSTTSEYTKELTNDLLVVSGITL